MVKLSSARLFCRATLGPLNDKPGISDVSLDYLHPSQTSHWEEKLLKHMNSHTTERKGRVWGGLDRYVLPEAHLKVSHRAGWWERPAWGASPGPPSGSFNAHGHLKPKSCVLPQGEDQGTCSHFQRPPGLTAVAGVIQALLVTNLAACALS